MPEAEEKSIEEITQGIVAKLDASPEVVALAQEVDLRDPSSVMQFGGETAHEISTFADQILQSISSTSVEDSSVMLTKLNKVMDKFDPKDFKDEGLINKLIRNAKKKVEAMLAKYNSMGKEVDQVFVELKKYEGQIDESNQTLSGLFDRNLEYYEVLEKYILAGQKILAKLNDEILPQLREKAETSGQQLDNINLSRAIEIQEILDQRLYDLNLSRTVALQALPQIKLIQKGNYNLRRKINSAFIVTIPIFKQALIQTITLKRQNLQAKALSALDEKTNELLLRNAQMTADQAKMTAQLASGPSIKVETLEKSWQTIMNGINETQAIEQQAKAERSQGVERLEALTVQIKETIQEKGRQ